MIKRFGALALVAASLPLLATATPALAQTAGNSGGPPCGNGYNNGQPFRFAVGTEGPRTSAATVKRGAEVDFVVTVVRNNTNTRRAEKCANRPVKFTPSGTGFSSVLRAPTARERALGATQDDKKRLHDKTGAFVFSGQTINSKGVASGLAKRTTKDFATGTAASDAAGVASYSFDTSFVANDTDVSWIARLDDGASVNGKSIRVSRP